LKTFQKYTNSNRFWRIKHFTHLLKSIPRIIIAKGGTHDRSLRFQLGNK